MKEIFLNDVVVSFPNLTAKHALEGYPNSVPKYGATFLLELNDPQVQMIKDAVMEIASIHWGAGYENLVRNVYARGAKDCFFGDGNTKITKDGQIVAGYENKIFVTAKNEKRPQMIHSLNPKQDVLPDEVMELAGAIYGGCFVSTSLNIYVQKDKQGIRACLNAIQFRKAGEPFGTVVGDQRSKFSQVEVAPLGAQTTQPVGAPVQQPVQTAQPVTQPTNTTQVVQQSTFDPATGQPVTQLTQEAQAVNQPVQQQQPVQPAGAFDPATGQPVQQNTGFQSEAATSPVQQNHTAVTEANTTGVPPHQW
jgi:hypothetical protein